ncbi:hypothetical protein [Flexivirga meconopsidis]|uniref:hypothetical protein n=1 Tax=Flexivirga meconopsidis TaxID=2977121 RepID=UPI00223EEBBD|nr:hypothetical protein [Flexivirga meconopsidis]
MSELIRSVLSWPVAFLVAILIFRRQIAGALDRLRRFSGGGVQLELDEALASARASADESAGDQAIGPRASLPDGWADRAEDDPSGLILTAWSVLERRMNEAARQVDPQVRTRTAPRGVLAALREAGVVDARFVDAAWNLRLVRNTVAHAPGARPTKEQALSFARTAAQLIGELPTG